MISITNYAMLALLDMSAMALIPLVWSTPIELGGLNLSPASIGLWLSAYGCLNGVLQFVLFPRIVGRLGPGRVILTSMAAFVIIYTMFPFENLAARYAAHGGGTKATVWLLVSLQLASICITDMGFSEFPETDQYTSCMSDCATLYPLGPKPNQKKNRFGVYVYCCSSSQQAFARRHERISADGSRHPTHGRPCSRRVIVRFFSGE
jgi:hypothetical protein